MRAASLSHIHCVTVTYILIGDGIIMICTNPNHFILSRQLNKPQLNGDLNDIIELYTCTIFAKLSEWIRRIQSTMAFHCVDVVLCFFCVMVVPCENLGIKCLYSTCHCENMGSKYSTFKSSTIH